MNTCIIYHAYSLNIKYIDLLAHWLILVAMLKCLSIHNFRVRVMVFNVTFNNISVVSWQSVLLVEETGENHESVTDKLYHMLYRVRHEQDSKTQL